MYTIGNIFFGLPFKEQCCLQASDADFSPFANLVRTYYSGSADVPPAAFGVSLSLMDECDITPINSLRLTPNSVQEGFVKDAINKLSEKQRGMLKDGEPFVFILWSTS